MNRKNIIRDEFFDDDSVKKLNDLRSEVIKHDIHPVEYQATITAIILHSEKYRESRREDIKSVLNNIVDNDKFRWSQHTKLLDWGIFMILPKWLKIRPRPFPMALWRLWISFTSLVTILLLLIIIIQIL